MWPKRYILLLILLVAIAVSDVHGDGCFVWRRGADLNEPSQKAIIYWREGKEVLILQVKYEGQAEDFAWIVPLPAQPEVTAIDADKSPFAEISLYTQIRLRRGRGGKSIAAAESEEMVTVLERKIVGIYDLAVLSASDPGALNKCNNNGYAFPIERRDLLEHYTKKNWVYVAMRIDPNALEKDEVEKLKVGELQPIRFAFAVDEMVYPLKISSSNAGETELLLYLLADAPMVVKAKNNRQGLSIENNLVPYIAPRTIKYLDPQYGTYSKTGRAELPLTWEALDIAGDIKLSLCKYRSVYASEEMTDDLVFECFKPMAYWKKRFSKQPERENYQKENDRKRAFTVLAWHDIRLLQEFSKDKYPKNRELVAMHPKSSEELLLELAKDDTGLVKHCLVNNRNLPTSVLQKLAKDKDKRLRYMAAMHPNTSIEMLWEFTRDEDPEVRRSTVNHHAITKEMLEFLSEDKDETVRAYVAYKAKTSVDLLRKLAKDKSSHVRVSVAQQSGLSKELAEELARDNSDEVRRLTAFSQKLHVETLLMLSNDTNAGVRAGAACNSQTPVEVLRKLAKDKETGVRSSVAGNPNTPIEVLRKLAEDKETNIRLRVAGNSNTPEDVLACLADDDEKSVRYSVASNSGTPKKILLKLSEDANSHVSWRAKLTLSNRKAD